MNAQYKPELLEILHNKPLNELSPIEKVLLSEEDWRLQNLALQELADYELRLDLLAKGATWEHNENVRLNDDLAALHAQLDALKQTEALAIKIITAGNLTAAQIATQELYEHLKQQKRAALAPESETK